MAVSSWRTGRLGMTLFFVLSGFVIHYNYGDSVRTMTRRALWSFAVARFARLYPLYVAVIVVDAIYFNSWFAPYDYWGYTLTLTQSWFPFRGTNTQYLASQHVGLAWSISVEVFLYFCYVAVCRPLGRLTSTRSILVAISALVVVSTIGFGVVLLRIQAWQDWDWTFYISPYCRIPEFFLGALTAALFQKVPKANVTLLGCASLAWVLTFLFGPAIFPRNIGDLYHLCWMFAPGVAGLIYTLAVKRHAFFENKGVLVLGEASYSMYLLQPYVIASVLLVGGDMTNVWVVVSKCALIFVWLSATSIASFTCLEVPARRFIRSMLNPDRRLRYDAVSVPTFPEPAG